MMRGEGRLPSCPHRRCGGGGPAPLTAALCRVGGWGLPFHGALRNARGFCALKRLGVDCKDRTGAHNPQQLRVSPRPPTGGRRPSSCATHPGQERAAPSRPLGAWPSPLIKSCTQGGLPKSPQPSAWSLCPLQGAEPGDQRSGRLEMAGLSVPTRTPILLSFPHGLVHISATPRAPARVPEAAPCSAWGAQRKAMGVEHRPSSLTPFASCQSLQPYRPISTSPCPGPPSPHPSSSPVTIYVRPGWGVA